jgi:hypothetical protein
VAEKGRRVRPIPHTQHVAKGCTCSQSSGSGDTPGGTWSRVDACLPKAKCDATTDGSSVHGLMREGPTKEERTVLKIQKYALLHDETHSPHWAQTQVLFPRLDVEWGRKTARTVCLCESGRDEAKVLTFLPKMQVDAQEGLKLRRPLGGGERHEENPLWHQLERGSSAGHSWKMPKTLRGSHGAGMNLREGLSLNTPLIKRLMRRRSPTLTPSTGATDIEIEDPWVAMVLQDIHMP